MSKEQKVTDSTTHVAIAIIGTGFAGIGASIQLRQHGFDDFVIFERADDVGGVWRDNTYPGAACDVESHLYSFSFAPHPDWSRMFSPQAEILDYLRACARRWELHPRIRFGHEVREARWSEDEQTWSIETSRGRFTADIVIAGMGGLSEPSTPRLPGIERFRGEVFHSARWNHDVDLRGKRVAVIGSGASAVQIVPAIQPLVESLTLFQRTPAWVLPRFDRAVGARERRLYRALPWTQKLSRASIYLRRELLVLGFRHPRAMRLLEAFARAYLREVITDPVLRARLTPHFRLGCKRILISSDYLPALTQPNVTVVSDTIRGVGESGIVTQDELLHEADVIIFATGFHVADLPFARRVHGKDGRTLQQAWNGSLESLRTTTVAGFPNLFLLLGPSSGVGHTSVIHILESQLRLVLDALSYMRRERIAVIEARAEAQAKFMRALQHEFDGTVWLEGGCKSWYLDQRGRATTLWPGFTFGFRHMAKFVASEYALHARQPPSRPWSRAAE
jgi:cation diffusion facilitator CzcD-associated flavoprotein CzcO